MSNKTSDKNVANIERLNNFANMTFLYGNRVSLNKDNLKEIQQDLKYLLAELEQKDKRIQELEEENSKTQIMSPYCVKENYIPKQVIIDKIEELKNNLKYIDCNRDCSKCFNKEGKALYRGSDFDFCFAYYQIKDLQELLEGEK